MILYTEPGFVFDPGLIPNTSLLSGNYSVRLDAPDLGFVAIDIPANRSEYFRNELLTLPWITGVEPDQVRIPEYLSTSEPEPGNGSVSWEITRTRIPEAWELLAHRNSSAPEIRVALLDTGVEPTHPDLAGFIGPGGYDWIDDSSNITDTDGHGTYLAGILATCAGGSGMGAGGVNLSLIPERVGTGRDGILATRSAVAIRHAADAGATIILMGYGGPGQSPAEETAIAYAVQKGCLLIAPAGNGATNEAHYPSDYYEVLSVGSTARSDGLSYFSNYGIFVELVAPGEGIVSAWPGHSHQAATGTSPAAALVAGTAALVRAADPDLDPSDIRDILSSTSHDLGRYGRDIYYGYGLLDAGSAVAVAVPSDDRADTAELLASLMNSSASNQSFSAGSTNVSEQMPVKRESPVRTRVTALELGTGWNFISLPAVPGSGKTCGEIFGGINTDGHTIWRYDTRNQDWIAVEEQGNFSPLEGFLVFSDRPVSVPLVFADPGEQLRYSVSPGWNLVGSPYQAPETANQSLASLSPGWVSLLIFNTTTQSYDPAIIPGASGVHSDTRILPAFSAYWVYIHSAEEHPGEDQKG